MAREHIYDKDFGYSILKVIADFYTFQAYRRYRITGRENYPADGSVIISPNHANCLMDAMVILGCTSEAKSFVARADIFRNPKIASILTFLRMMPIMRKRDGMGEVAKNDEIIENAIAILQHEMPFCIMPEGAHQPKHSMLPLGKGIFRIALGTMEGFDGKLYIQPVGLEYSDYFHYRGNLLLSFGKPIDVSAFKAENPDKSNPVIINMLKAELGARMRELILYIPNDEWYDATLLLTAIGTEGRGLEAELASKKAVAAKIARLREENPEKATELLSKADILAKECIAKNVDMTSVAHRKYFAGHLLRVILTIVGLNYIAICALLSSPVTLIGEKFARKMKDRAFRNSIRYAATLIWPILLIIYGVLLFVFLPWKWALGILIAISPAINVTHDTIRAWRIFLSDLRLKSIPGAKARILEISTSLSVRKYSPLFRRQS